MFVIRREKLRCLLRVEDDVEREQLGSGNSTHDGEIDFPIFSKSSLIRPRPSAFYTKLYQDLVLASNSLTPPYYHEQEDRTLNIPSSEILGLQRVRL